MCCIVCCANDFYYKLLDKVDNFPSEVILKEWQDLIEEVCGNSQSLKDELIEAAVKDNRISEKAKAWIRKTNLT